MTLCKREHRDGKDIVRAGIIIYYHLSLTGGQAFFAGRLEVGVEGW